MKWETNDDYFEILRAYPNSRSVFGGIKCIWSLVIEGVKCAEITRSLQLPEGGSKFVAHFEFRESQEFELGTSIEDAKVFVLQQVLDFSTKRLKEIEEDRKVLNKIIENLLTHGKSGHNAKGR